MLNSSLKDARILIVDDQESNIALLEDVLGRYGYADLKSTTDSRQVVAMVEEYHPDLILLDLLMPHLDGFAVMEMLRARVPRDDFLPILVLTADITPEIRLRALASGASDFLTKPFDLSEVSLRIGNLLETRNLHLRLKDQNRILEETVLERTSELRQRVDDLALINSLTVAINNGEDLRRIVGMMSEELHRMFDCIGTMTALPEPGNERMRIQQMELPPALMGRIDGLAGVVIRSLPLGIPMTGEGQFAQALRSGAPRAINDAATIKATMCEFTDNALLKGLASPVFDLLGIGSMLMIPLVTETGIHGLLEMVRTGPTTEGDLTRVQAIAGQLTAAIKHRQAEESIKRSLHEKETLIREIHHRTKNTIQVINAIIAIQAGDFPDNSQLQMVVRNTEDRIQAISLVHEMLYKSQDLSRISIKDYIQELATLILRSYGIFEDRIVVVTEIDDQCFLLDTAIPLGLILNELMTNSLRHAFPDDADGTISITLGDGSSGNTMVRYSDDGVGVPDGFDFRNTSTLGLKLVHSIGEGQLLGVVAMENRKGVQFSIEFSKNIHTARI